LGIVLYKLLKVDDFADFMGRFCMYWTHPLSTDHRVPHSPMYL